MQIIWAEHDGNRIEELIGVMLCREFKFANRIRPSQGDGGIDVMVPVGDGMVDIYQVKGFTSSFTDSQKTQVKKSLDRISANSHVRLREWHLVVPVNPTPELKFNWFDPLIGGCEFDCHWFGLDQCVGLASKYPEVTRYYLGDGQHKLERAIADLRAISPLRLSGETPGQMVALNDLRTPFAAAIEAVNRTDPHYRYDLMVTKHMPFGLESPPPAQPDGLDVAAILSERVSDDAVVTFLIIPRYAEADLDRPIRGSFLIPTDESGNPVDQGAATFLEFGAAAEFTVDEMTFDLPGGLTWSAVQGLVRVAPVAQPGSGEYDLRLVTVDEAGQTLGECVCHMQPVTRGVTASPGVYAHGTSETGLFKIKMQMRPQDGTASMRFHLNSLTGCEPAAIASEIWFLHSLASANHIRVGARFGPLVDGGIPIEHMLPSMFEERLLRLIDDMALIQREACAGLRIPDLDDIDSETVKLVRIAATLLRGAGVRTNYTEQRFTMPAEISATLRDNLGVAMLVEIVGSWQSEILGHRIVIEPVDMQLRSAILALDATDDNLVVATPAQFSDEMLIRRRTEP